MVESSADAGSAVDGSGDDPRHEPDAPNDAGLVAQLPLDAANLVRGLGVPEAAPTPSGAPAGASTGGDTVSRAVLPGAPGTAAGATVPPGVTPATPATPATSSVTAGPVQAGWASSATLIAGGSVTTGAATATAAPQDRSVAAADTRTASGQPATPVPPVVPMPVTVHAAAPAAVAGDPAHVPSAPLAAQVSRTVLAVAAAGPGQHVVTVRVSPEHLGPLTVQAHIGADGVRIELFSPTEAGRAAVHAVLADLRRDLAATGLGASLDLSDRGAPLHDQTAHQGHPRHPGDPERSSQPGQHGQHGQHGEQGQRGAAETGARGGEDGRSTPAVSATSTTSDAASEPTSVDAANATPGDLTHPPAGHPSSAVRLDVIA